MRLGPEELEGVSPEQMASLRDETLRLIWRRAAEGSVVYALVGSGFVIADMVAGRLGAGSLVVPFGLFGCVAVHVTALRPRGGMSTRWQQGFFSLIVARTALFAVYVAAALLSRGLTTSTWLMLLALSGLLAGITHTFAAWPSLLFATAACLVVPPVAAATAVGHHTILVLAIVQSAYALVLGRAVFREHWASAGARARLVTTVDAMHAAQRRARDLIERNPDAIAILRDETIVFANAAWATAARTTREALIGKSLDAVMEADQKRVLLDFATGQSTSAVAEVRFRGADSAPTTWEIVRSEPFDDGGADARMLVARDVTERNRLRAHVMLGERLASIGTLAAGVAHEINNPLTYVLGNIDHTIETLGRSDLAEKEELLQALREARHGADRVRVIVRDLKAFSRVEEGRVAAVDLRALLELTAKMAAHELRHRARLVLRLDGAPAVLADEARLSQVFLNLIVNAAQSIPEGRADDNEVRVEARSLPDGRAEITVTDTGSGIPKENLSRIFDPFFTTKPVGIGTGLGLSIVHGILQACGGEISVASELGRGTTMTVTLPAIVRPAQRSAAGPASVGGAVGRILFVDDEEGIGDVIRRLFRGRYEVEVASSADEAARQLQSGHFDLVLCDLMMPERTGMDLFEEITAAHPELAHRFIFMTGGTFTERARKFLDRTPNECIEKPFEVAALRQLLLERLGAPRP